MEHRTRDLVKDWRRGDAEKLARLMMEADVAWPGGGGYQTTPEEQERHIRESNLLGAFVTEDRTRIISLCTLRAKPGQKEHAFIPHLNCLPDFHGKKHGKAVLRAAVDRAGEAGYRKVDLYTWPANMKAVPLYKKMGFMWEPDTSVHMENFTLAARQHPLGRAYFSRHDWYETHVRSLTLEEDLVKRGKVRVYEYLWRAGDGSFLRMVFDRKSWGIIEAENRDLLVSCNLPDEKLIAGIPHPVRWRIVNRRPNPARVLLSASGDPGIDIRQQEVLEVRDSAEVEGTFTIDPNIPEKTQDPRAAILRTEVLVDGLSVPLAAGIEAQQAVVVSLDPPRSILRPGIPQEAILTLRSNLDRKATARLSVLPGGGTTVHRREYRVPLKPKGGAEVRVPLTATGEGPVRLEVEARASVGKEEIPIKAKRIDLLSVGPEGVSACVGEDAATLAGGGLLASVDLRWGQTSVYHRLRAERAYRCGIPPPRVGPPFSWEDFFQEKAEASIEEEPTGVAVRIRSKSILRPGLVLDRRIVLGQGPLLKVTDTILNGSAVRLDLDLSQGWGFRLGSDRESEPDTVIPRERGIIREPGGAGGRGLGSLKLREEGKASPEGWVCRQRGDGCAVGFLWGRAERAESGSWSREIRRRIGRLEPGGSAMAEPVYCFVGDGNWQTVRGWWRILFGEGVPETEQEFASTLKPIQLSIDPNPLLVRGDETRATVSLRNAGTYKLDGRIEMEPPAGLRPDSGAIEVASLCEARPVVRSLGLLATPRLPRGSSRIGLRFETDEAIYRSSGEILVLSRRAREVRVSREDGGTIFTIRNGILIVKVAPGFLGSVVSLQREGREFLHSAYPEARAWGPFNPWFGGISPRHGWLWGSMHKERFRARAVRRRGRQGLEWEGVRVSCAIRQERARGQSIALEYLLAPGADVLAVVATCREGLGIRSDGDVGFLMFPAFGTAPGSATFYNPSDPSITPLVASHYSEAGSWRWGGLAGDGMSLFVSASGEGAGAGGEYIPPGCLMGASVGGSMPARSGIGGLFFVVPAFGPETAETHAVWSRFEALP